MYYNVHFKLEQPKGNNQGVKNMKNAIIILATIMTVFFTNAQRITQKKPTKQELIKQESTKQESKVPSSVRVNFLENPEEYPLRDVQKIIRTLEEKGDNLTSNEVSVQTILGQNVTQWDPTAKQNYHLFIDALVQSFNSGSSTTVSQAFNQALSLFFDKGDFDGVKAQKEIFARHCRI